MLIVLSEKLSKKTQQQLKIQLKDKQGELKIKSKNKF